MKTPRFPALFVCLCLLLALSSCGPSSAANLTAPWEALPDSVAFYVGGEPVSHAEFNFHVVTYIDKYAQSEEGRMSGFDPSLPLTEQYYDDETTMEDKIKDDTIRQLQSYVALSLEAESNGYESGDWEQQQIEAFFAELEVFVADSGIPEQAAIRNKYGIDMTREQLYAFLTREFTAKGYETHWRAATDYTDQEIADFYEERKRAVVLPDCSLATLRIIHFDNKQMALDVMEKFEQTDKSERAFVELVKLYATDEAEMAYEGLYPKMSPSRSQVSAFDEVESWVFDKARVPGEYRVLELESGSKCLFVYFVEQGEPFWKAWSRFEKQSADIQAIVDGYGVAYSGE